MLGSIPNHSLRCLHIMDTATQILITVKESQLKILIVIITLLTLWESVLPAIEMFKEAQKERLFHAGKNWALAGINLLIQRFFFIGLWLLTQEFSEEHGWGLLRLIDIPLWAQGLLAFVILDYWTYWWHRLLHKVPFLWNFHQVHHSDPTMDVSTAYRFHFGEIFLSSFLRIPFIFFLGLELWEIVLFDTLIFINIQIHHANISFHNKIDSIFSLFLTSPKMHKIHHSIKAQEHNSNFTFFLSIWDHLHGTYKTSNFPELIKFGLPNHSTTKKQTIYSLITSPFRRN